jgi:hypothetical protein
MYPFCLPNYFYSKKEPNFDKVEKIIYRTGSGLSGGPAAAHLHLHLNDISDIILQNIF